SQMGMPINDRWPHSRDWAEDRHPSLSPSVDPLANLQYLSTPEKRDSLNLQELSRQREPGHSDSRPCRKFPSDVLGFDFCNGTQVLYVDMVGHDLHQVVEGQPGGRQHHLDVLKHLLRLRANIPEPDHVAVAVSRDLRTSRWSCRPPG